jgi:hypothetical protein
MNPTGTGVGTPIYFTKTNVGGYFSTKTDGLKADQAKIVKFYGETFLSSALVTLENAPALAQQNIDEMFGTYAKIVGHVVHGWGGNA